MAFTEPLACVVNSVNRTNIELGDDVVVIGGGTMGLLHVMVAKLRGARVIVSEPLEERRERALRLGASAAIDPIHADAVEEVKKLTEGRGAAVVYNTTANPVLMAQAMNMTAPCGTCVAFSSQQAGGSGRRSHAFSAEDNDRRSQPDGSGILSGI